MNTKLGLISVALVLLGSSSFAAPPKYPDGGSSLPGFVPKVYIQANNCVDPAKENGWPHIHGACGKDVPNEGRGQFYPCQAVDCNGATFTFGYAYTINASYPTWKAACEKMAGVCASMLNGLRNKKIPEIEITTKPVDGAQECTGTPVKKGPDGKPITHKVCACGAGDKADRPILVMPGG